MLRYGLQSCLTMIAAVLVLGPAPSPGPEAMRLAPVVTIIQERAQIDQGVHEEAG